MLKKRSAFIRWSAKISHQPWRVVLERGVDAVLSFIDRVILKVGHSQALDAFLIARFVPSVAVSVTFSQAPKAPGFRCFLRNNHVDSTILHHDFFSSTLLKEAPFRADNSSSPCRAGKVSIVITTSLASRGLAASSVPVLILHDLPATVPEYVSLVRQVARSTIKGRVYSLITK
jgi:hypothetical protein